MAPGYHESPSRSTFYKKNAVVTGGNNGIGRAIVIQLAKAGANVFFTYHSDSDAADSLLLELNTLNPNGEYGSVSTDLAIDFQVDDVINASHVFFNGHIDYLVNNAGVLSNKRFLELDDQEMKHTLDVNFFAAFKLIREFSKNMVEEQLKCDAQGRSRFNFSIVNIASISQKVMTFLPAYEISKDALTRLTKCAALELAIHKIRVNQVNPGLTETNLNKAYWQKNPTLWNELKSGIPMNKTGNIDNIAWAVMNFLDSRSEWTTGEVYNIDGGRRLNYLGGDYQKQAAYTPEQTPRLPRAKL